MFYTGLSLTVSTGDKVVHGQQGEVTGPATAESHKGKGVNVLFPGNKGTLDCCLTMVRRLPAASTCAPHTRRCPRPTRPRDSLCRGAPAHTARAAARAVAQRPAPECGEGVLVRASGF